MHSHGVTASFATMHMHARLTHCEAPHSDPLERVHEVKQKKFVLGTSAKQRAGEDMIALAEWCPFKATSQQRSGQSRGTRPLSRGSKRKLKGTRRKLGPMPATDQASQVQACTQFLMGGFFSMKKMAYIPRGMTTTGRQRRKYGQYSTLSVPSKGGGVVQSQLKVQGTLSARAAANSLHMDLNKEQFAMYTCWVEAYPCNGSSKAEEAQKVKQTVLASLLIEKVGTHPKKLKVKPDSVDMRSPSSN